MIRCNRGGPDALYDDWGDGRPCRLTEGQQATLKAIVLLGPDPEVDGLDVYVQPTWRLIDLCRIVRERFGVQFWGPHSEIDARGADAGVEARLRLLAGQIARQSSAMTLDAIRRGGAACKTVRGWPNTRGPRRCARRG